MARAARRTTDHDEIRTWAERHGGHPAAVKGTGRGGDPGILRIDFPDFGGEETLEPISWDIFFEWFDRNELALLHRAQERFNKLVSRRTAEVRARGARRRTRVAAAKVKPTASRRKRAEAGEPGAEPETRGGPRAAAAEAEREAPAAGEAEVEVPADAPNAVDLLLEQHREIGALFDRYEDAPASEKEGVFARLADVLASHMKIEETIFYPTMLSERTRDELRESVEQHLVLKRIVADLLGMLTEDEQFDPKMEVLREVADRHHAEEERQLFKIARRVDGETLRAIGGMMKSAYDALIEGRPREELRDETGSAASLPGA